MGSDDRIIPPVEFSSVSIHAPAWGATFKRILVLKAEQVSIHAPAWGATYPFSSNNSATSVSIHAPAWGATKVLGRLGARFMFQSTLPHGERLY